MEEAEGGNDEATLDLNAARLDLGPTVYTKALQCA